MTLRGKARNGVVIFDNDTAPPNGTLVEVTPIVELDDRAAAPAVPAAGRPIYPVSAEQRKALLELIGMWKVEHPPNDEEVERIIEECRMKKFG
jgi:hypothetical protein